jgi:hypothetical protein
MNIFSEGIYIVGDNTGSGYLIGPCRIRLLAQVGQDPDPYFWVGLLSSWSTATGSTDGLYVITTVCGPPGLAGSRHYRWYTQSVPTIACEEQISSTKGTRILSRRNKSSQCREQEWRPRNKQISSTRGNSSRLLREQKYWVLGTYDVYLGNKNITCQK